MRILVIDTENMLLDFVLRCTAADHEVRWFKYPDNGKVTRDGEGFKGFRVISDWRDSMPWAREGLILISGNFKYMNELDRYREFGYRIFGPTNKSADLEIKRSVGLEAMRAAGIDIPPYKEFKSLEEAEAFARKSDDCWVFKTMGDEADKSLSYVSCDPADMCGWIRQKIDRGLVLKGPCILQEKIDMLAEVGVSGWFGADGFLPNKWQTCWEHKRQYPGEIGQNCGEQGTVTQYVADDKIADEVLKPMEPILRVLGHRGDFAIGAGVDTKGKIWPFEWTSRLGFPAVFLQIASHKGDPAAWMLDLLDGKDSLKVSNDVCIGVVCSQPNYPSGKSPAELVEGNPISVNEDDMNDIHFCSVMIGKGPKLEGGKVVDRPMLQTTGEYVLVTTGLGKTVSAARRKVYRSIDGIKFPNIGYRDDIGCKLEKVLPKLHRFGYVLETDYE